MTIMRFFEIIHNWMGWCPNVDKKVPAVRFRINEEGISSPIKGLTKEHVHHWFTVFKNQIILSTIGTMCTGLFLFFYMGNWLSYYPFFLGILAGLPISAVTGIWYSRIFNELLHDGPIELWNRYDTIVFSLVLVSITIALIPYTAVLGGIPGISLPMICSFSGGFVVVLFWGLLVGIHVWETGTHQRLLYDGTILCLENKD